MTALSPLAIHIPDGLPDEAAVIAHEARGGRWLVRMRETDRASSVTWVMLVEVRRYNGRWSEDYRRLRGERTCDGARAHAIGALPVVWT